MKGRKLTLQEVLNLEDGTKVWVEDTGIGFIDSLCQYDESLAHLYALKENGKHYDLNIFKSYHKRLTFYEWVEELEIPYPNNMQQTIKDMAQEICNLRGLDLTDDNIRLIVEEFS